MYFRINEINYLRLLMPLALLFLCLKVGAMTPQEAVDEFVRTSGVKSASVAVKITDLSDGTLLGSHNPEAPLVPASIMKSVTTAALLSECGPDFHYKTNVYVDGPLDMGILRGNLIIEGASDPSVNSVPEPCGTDFVREITDVVKAMGINKIEGMVIIDEDRFAGPARPASWQPADFSQSYGTGSHAFNFENNSSGRKSVENPSALFRKRLITSLGREEIVVDGKDVGDGARNLIYTHVSPPIDEIMRSCMMRSDNLFAESMLRTYGKLTGGDGSTKDAASREMKMWREKNLPLGGVNIIDGSGLSRENRVTADFMSDVLSSMAGNPVYASFFPLAGQEGTLKRFLAETPLDSYIAMKTGSMKGIQCYAGYMLDDDYAPTHSVVIIMNDITGSRDRAVKAAQKMLLEVFGSQVKESTGELSEEPLEPVEETMDVIIEQY